MKDADRYAKIVQWSEEDACFVGRIPDLCDGGCHGPDPKAVFDELCQIAEEWIEIFKKDGTPLPRPTNLVTPTSKKERRLFKEISEGFDALAEERQGKRVQRTKKSNVGHLKGLVAKPAKTVSLARMNRAVARGAGRK